MTDAAEDPLAGVVPFERYRDAEVGGLHVRVTVPDDILETGQRGVSPTVVVYELVDGERGRFIANIFRLDSPRPLERFNIHAERTLSAQTRAAVADLAKEWWRRRRGWRPIDPALWPSATHGR
ncbi:MAG TPA: hypothetical protein VFU12_18425 [Glycomyces sp.]|nr:hypothetical protein [Glycomyces sp.]